MIQKKLTINLPESAEILRRLISFLLQYDLISEKEALTLEPDEPAMKKKEKSRWATAAEEMSKENLLSGGLGEELRQHIHEFREGFYFKGSFKSKEG
jgi:hypothetical protein